LFKAPKFGSLFTRETCSKTTLLSSVLYQYPSEKEAEEMRIFSLMLFSLSVSGGHTIFDEVGLIASAVSYTHVAINLDFVSIWTSLVNTK
jgi:hypothetical protein